ASQPLFAKFGRKASVEDRYIGLSSMYHGLQAKLDRRFSGGFALTTSYTYSKAEGFQSEDSGHDFYIKPHRNWRRLDFDRRHFFAQSYVYELPFGKGKQFLQSGVAGAVMGGWQVNGVLQIASGAPIDFGGSSAILNAPGNNNTLNWLGPGPIPIYYAN